MELAAIKMCKIEYDTSKEVIISRINRIEEAIKSGKIAVRAKAETKEPDMVKESKPTQATRRPEKKEDVSINTSFNEDSKISIDEVKRAWKDILERFKARRAMVVYASLSTGKPVSCNNGVIEIQYEDQYGFNKSRLEKPDTSKLVNEVFSEVLKDGVRVKYSVITEEVRGKTTEEILLDTIGEDALEILDE
jgi:DNA polymerase-3 subunit gamma/tau